MKHTTVLLHEAVEALALQPHSVVVDATLGSGGHSRNIASQLTKEGILIALDADASALAVVGDIPSAGTVKLVHGNFANITHHLAALDITEVDAILADLGWRMEQFSDSQKGFSFNDAIGLEMTYGEGKDYAFTAADIVNEWAAEDIANVLYGYGEERYSRRIAAAIVAARKVAPITSGTALADIISQAVPAGYRKGRTHPATKSFQGLRIAVNDELTVLDTFITEAFLALRPKGRLAIISFHSIEDRIVKQRFRALSDEGVATLLTKKPLTASPEELQDNPRSRSAKLRILQKL